VLCYAMLCYAVLCCAVQGDKLRLGEKGWRGRYYADKFEKTNHMTRKQEHTRAEAQSNRSSSSGGSGGGSGGGARSRKDVSAMRHGMCVEYIRGLCWVMRYYMEGVPSWTW
jgi:5'-3' exonuclease